MKLNRLILFLTVVALSMRLYFVFYGRRESYVQEDVDPNEIRGNVSMTSYDNKETKTFEVVVDGKYLMLKGKNEDGVEFYVTFKNDEITNTNTMKPQGEYKFRLMKSLNGDAGYHSLAMGDSNRYFMIDVTNFDAGVVDLNGVDDLSKKVQDPRAFNFKFKKM